MLVPIDLIIEKPLQFTHPAAQGDPDTGEFAVLVLTLFQDCTITVNGQNPLDPAYNGTGMKIAVINPGDAVVITPTAASGRARGHYDPLPGRVGLGHRYPRATVWNATNMGSGVNLVRTTFTTTAKKAYGDGTPASSGLILTGPASLAGMQAKFYEGSGLLATYTFSQEVKDSAAPLGNCYRALFLPDQFWTGSPGNTYTLEVSRPDATGGLKMYMGSTDQAIHGGPNGSALLGISNLSTQYSTITDATLKNTAVSMLFEIGHFPDFPR
ncbi:hypothetical protein D3875_04125 [Deinococcus cavernae]|uniref:Uncharacterized protein n=1 Tax=Deinococcus cavernae TaxID=2320857 RepID=A0A418VEE1_9DEIO|nr:hypothetical protein [Deinococcus cavernae]RJF74474.1 hypothetical protein D3875_04125 [Deinococcus cavernae]